MILEVNHAWCSGYDCRFSVRGFLVRNLWIANFRFSFHEIFVQNQCGHETLRLLVEDSYIAVQVRLPLVRI